MTSIFKVVHASTRVKAVMMENNSRTTVTLVHVPMVKSRVQKRHVEVCKGDLF